MEQVVTLATQLAGQGVDRLVLADTSGLAAPPTVRRMLAAVAPGTGSIPLGLHFHDTRGLGLANVMAALEMGIYHFDSSLGGLGGCPFIEGAAGNIATEDLLYLLDRLGIDTGIDIGRVAFWGRYLADFFGDPLPGKTYRLAASF
jgi:hydroxymethylglutaryl-CoA lyase